MLARFAKPDNLTLMMLKTEQKCAECHGEGVVKIWKPQTLRKHRKGHGIALSAMAKRVGISISYLCEIETGNRNIPEKVVKSYLKLK